MGYLTGSIINFNFFKLCTALMDNMALNNAY